MRLMRLESSNPALRNEEGFNPYAYAGETAGAPERVRSDAATLNGVVQKTMLFIGLAIAGGAVGYRLLPVTGGSVVWISALAAMIVGVGVAIVLAGKPHLASALGPVYAVVEGVFLGSLTAALESVLQGMGYAAAGGLALQAFLITIGVFLAMFALYWTRILRPSRTFVAALSVMTAGIMVTYLLGFILGLFGIAIPFLSIGSALQGGTAAWIGLGLNVLILAVASLWLVVDFQLVENIVDRGQPKAMEWYAAFALTVTLAWIYYEAVKTAFRLAVMFGSRE